MTHRTARQWRTLVEKAVGQKFEGLWQSMPYWDRETQLEKMWEYIEEDGGVDKANGAMAEDGNDRWAVKYLANCLRQHIKNHFRYSGTSLPEEKEPRIASLPKEKPPDTQTAAYSKIIACLLNKEEAIQQFRSRFLDGKLLSTEQALSWIKSVAEKEGADQEVSITFSANLDMARNPDSIASECARAVNQGLFKSVRYSYPVLSCITPSGVETVPINSRGILMALKKLASDYENLWPEAAAVRFILTGQGYPVRRTVTHYGSDKHSIPWVSLRLHPSLSGDEVRNLYLEARRQLKDWPGNVNPKGLTEKHLALAVFVVEQPGSWGIKMREWNEAYPGWAYSAAARSTFARDCRDAYERLTGWKWQKKTAHRPLKLIPVKQLVKQFEGNYTKLG